MILNKIKTFDQIFGILKDPRSHSVRSKNYPRLSKAIQSYVARTGLRGGGNGRVEMGFFGSVQMPFTRMGSVTSLDLFGLDELLLFLFYWKNRHRFRRAVDIGANLGLHSILMARCGWKVEAYEPDPHHCKLLRRNLKLNRALNVRVREAAVSSRGGWAEFVRVVGNTTSSHLAGAKAGAYGKLQTFSVRLVPARQALASADFVKIDAEGHECEILESIPRSAWRKLCCVLEIGTPENASNIFTWAKRNQLKILSQKIFWKSCKRAKDMPKSYKEGSVVIINKESKVNFYPSYICKRDKTKRI